MNLKELEEQLLRDLTADLELQNRDEESIKTIQKAFRYAFDKHIEQVRKSSEPYIVHPVAVAKTLIQLKCDSATICAGLMHDLLEDTSANKEEIISIFNETIYELVDGVTKLGKLNFKSSQEEQANNFRKMLVAIAKDMRVVLVKLADRLNNMETLHYLEHEKRERIAKETLDIFAPLAHRFGLATIKNNLEDLSFKHLHPLEYKKIKDMVQSRQGEREEQIKIIQNKIVEMLKANHIEAETQGRAKHFYSIFRKLRNLGIDIAGLKEGDEVPVYDLQGIRLLVNSVRECYAALGVIHDSFRPMPGRFKDYIAVPKSNLYQSLHTTIIVPWGKPMEIQIRTHEMHEIAEHGIAAHWHYKEAGESSMAKEQEANQLAWLRQLISWQTDLEDAQEYLDTVKKDIFSQEVYVLTPKGDVFALPAGSTPIDCAFKIHSKIGETCTGAIVNEKIVPINYKLQNGDLVEIITNKNAHPNLSWLNFVKTNQAKHKIKAWYKKQNRDRHISMGQQMLEEKFGKEGIEQFIHSEDFLQAAQKLNYKVVEDLLAALGSGDNTIAQLQGRLPAENKYSSKYKEFDLTEAKKFKARKAPSQGDSAEIPALDGLLYSVAKCCMPIPGEHVMGVVSKGKGITIHRSDCRNLEQVETDRLMEINWSGKSADKTYPTNLTIEVVDRVGVVKDIFTLIADAGINIQNFKVKERPSETTALLKATINVSGREQLSKLLTSIQNMSDVLSIERR